MIQSWWNSWWNILWFVFTSVELPPCSVLPRPSKPPTWLHPWFSIWLKPWSSLQRLMRFLMIWQIKTIGNGTHFRSSIPGFSMFTSPTVAWKIILTFASFHLFSWPKHPKSFHLLVKPVNLFQLLISESFVDFFAHGVRCLVKLLLESHDDQLQTLDTAGQGVGGVNGLKTFLVKMKILRLCWSSTAACRPRSRWSALECRSCRAAAVPSCFCPASCSGFNTTNGFPRPFPTHHIWLDCLSLTIDNLIFLVRCLC